MNRNKLVLGALIAAVLFSLLLKAASGAAGSESEDSDKEFFFRGRVLSVEETNAGEGYSDISQTLQVKLTSGTKKGEIVTVYNYYIPGDPMFHLYIKEGDEVIVVVRGSLDAMEEVYLQDLARDRGIYYLLAVFAAVLLLIGKVKGLKTILTLIITGALVILVLLPLLLNGYSPIISAVLVASAAIILTLLIIGGFSKKSLSAIIGTVSGVIVAGFMALWAGSVSSLTGFNTQEAQMLYFMDYNLNIRGLLFAGLIIGSLGAITDIGMSVASAAAEIKEANPNMKMQEITLGALNVGRDVMGTMANTLILAYAGAAIPMLLLVRGYQMDWLKIINMDLIATEFVRGIAGSIGLVIAVPITAVISGFLQARPEKNSKSTWRLPVIKRD